MTIRQRSNLCQLIQWVAILIAVISGVYVILQGGTELGVGMIAAALSSPHVVTNHLPHCVTGMDRRISSVPVECTGNHDGTTVPSLRKEQ